MTRPERLATYEQVEFLIEQFSLMRTQIERMRFNMARSFEDVLADLDTLTTSAADRISEQNALIAELQAAVVAGDQARVQELAAQAARYADALEPVADRLRAVATDPDDVVPDPSPLPPVEDAPAEEVADEGTPAEDPDVAEEPAAPAPVEDDGAIVPDEQRF